MDPFDLRMSSISWRLWGYSSQNIRWYLDIFHIDYRGGKFLSYVEVVGFLRDKIQISDDLWNPFIVPNTMEKLREAREDFTPFVLRVCLVIVKFQWKRALSVAVLTCNCPLHIGISVSQVVYLNCRVKGHLSHCLK